MAARAIERRLNADTTDYKGPHLRCPCGQEARYVDRREKSFTTVLGQISLRRAYYHCGACGLGSCPKDVSLALTAGSLSGGVERMVAAVGAVTSFAEGSALLHELAGLTIECKHVERVAESLGERVAQDEEQIVEPPRGEVPNTLYLGLDGTGVPMRNEELAQRPGKQPDGSSKTREVKICAIWSAEHRDAEGTPVRDVGSVTYSAAIESAAQSDTETVYPAFAQRVNREAARRGFERASRRVVIGDGALWIWKLADEHFPGAIQIVDRFHAKEHLSDAGKAIWGPDSQLGREWTRQRHEQLDRGDLDGILQALAIHACAEPEAQRCGEYIRRNRHRMQYPAFHQRGLCTSTGVLEAGCKVTVGTRLKRPGMHWTVRGANAILALRCARLSNRFQDFWQRRLAA